MENENADIFTTAWNDEAGGGENDARREEPLPDTGEAGSAAGEAQETAKGAAEAREQGFARFVRLFPGVRGEDIPPEVWERVRQGESLTEAYLASRAGEVLQEKGRLERNRARSAGSQRGTGAGSVGRDPFDDGWETAF